MVIIFPALPPIGHSPLAGLPTPAPRSAIAVRPNVPTV